MHVRRIRINLYLLAEEKSSCTPMEVIINNYTLPLTFTVGRCVGMENTLPTLWVRILSMMSNIFLDWLKIRHLCPSDLRLSRRARRNTSFPDSWINILSVGPSPCCWLDQNSWFSLSSSNCTVLKRSSNKRATRNAVKVSLNAVGQTLNAVYSDEV